MVKSIVLAAFLTCGAMSAYAQTAPTQPTSPSPSAPAPAATPVDRTVSTGDFNAKDDMGASALLGTKVRNANKESIGKINEIQGTIATAVEEQTSTTNEVTRNVTEAATGATEIASNISGVAQAAQDSSEGAATTQNAASSLAQLAEELTRLVAQFTLDEGHLGSPTPGDGHLPGWTRDPRGADTWQEDSEAHQHPAGSGDGVAA